MAHKKAAWSTKNLKDSKPKYRGVKVFGWQKVKAWNIIIRQKGNKFECGKNVYMWRDFTVLSYIDWVVSFKKKNFKKFDWRSYLKTVVEVFPKDINNVKVEKSENVIEKKETVKKTPVKKSTTVKKETVKKTPAKKTPVKKTVTKKAE